MAEYIEKQAATMIPVLPKKHREYQTMNLDDAYENGWYDALECIAKLQPADVRPVVRGRWIPDEIAAYDRDQEKKGWVPWLCSECGWSVGKHQTTYCPNCGCEMKG